MLPLYEPEVVNFVSIDTEPFAISAFTIVPVAPPESVMTVVFAEKSIPSWLIILSPASVELESVPSKAILPSNASAFPKRLSPASVKLASVPFNAIKFPSVSFIK